MKNKEINWSDYMGVPIMFEIEYWTIEKSTNFVSGLNLKNKDDWKLYCKEGKKPDNIPFDPQSYYRTKGWKGWGVFLGTGRIANQNKKYLPFKEAIDFVRKLKLKSETEWRLYCKSGKKPDNIPQNPKGVYKKDFLSMPDWIGTNKYSRHFKPFEEARNYIRGLGFRSTTEWFRYAKSKDKPFDIPSNPQISYKKEFIDFCDWIGIENYKKIKKLKFIDARTFVRGLGLQNQSEWNKYCQEGKRHRDIPSNPYRLYKNDGWISWGDWLGNEK